MLQESFPLIFKLREIEIGKNMPVKRWLPWKRQVTWKKSPSLVAFASILKKLLTSKVAVGRICPPPLGLNRVKCPQGAERGEALGKKLILQILYRRKIRDYENYPLNGGWTLKTGRYIHAVSTAYRFLLRNLCYIQKIKARKTDAL